MWVETLVTVILVACMCDCCAARCTCSKCDAARRQQLVIKAELEAREAEEDRRMVCVPQHPTHLALPTAHIILVLTRIYVMICGVTCSSNISSVVSLKTNSCAINQLLPFIVLGVPSHAGGVCLFLCGRLGVL